MWKQNSNTAQKAGKNQTTNVSGPKPMKTPSYEVREIEVKAIKTRGRRRQLNEKIVEHLAESISTLGLQQPIIVREIKRTNGWGKITEPVLVAGLHRLEAVKRLGKETIPCITVSGKKRDARMVEISENLDRAELTPLERDEHLAEWVRLSQATSEISGQGVQKMRRGRPKGGVAEVARHFRWGNKSEGARRRTIERAVKVDGISPEAKKEARKAGLDKNHSALLRIAAEKTLDGQLEKIRTLRAGKSVAKEERHRDGRDDEGNQDLEELMSEWKKSSELRRRFSDASATVRDQFCSEIKEQANKGDWA
jgi:ParB family transcriptional regulator, chromosome partitioning protein